MKELIEKIKELQVIARPYCARMTCKQILEVIEDYESEPFDPVECGFKKSKYLEAIGINEVYVYRKKIKDILYEIYKVKNNIWNIERKDIVGCIDFDIKIPNHSFGVELLRNLGVVE